MERGGGVGAEEGRGKRERVGVVGRGVPEEIGGGGNEGESRGRGTIEEKEGREEEVGEQLKDTDNMRETKRSLLKGTRWGVEVTGGENGHLQDKANPRFVEPGNPSLRFPDLEKKKKVRDTPVKLDFQLSNE